MHWEVNTNQVLQRNLELRKNSRPHNSGPIDNYLNGIYCDPSFLVTQYNNNLYGSPSTWISLLQEKEHKIIFTPTSTITAEYIKRVSPINLAWIHLFADSEDRDQRLTARNISPNEINYRLTSGDSQGVNKSADVNINTSHMCEREIMNSIYFHIKLP